MNAHDSTNPDNLLSRRAVAARWSVSTETVKRRERDGLLKALKFNPRMTRYRLGEVERYERDALNTTDSKAQLRLARAAPRKKRAMVNQ